MDPSKNGRGHVFSEVFLMPNTHTGPGAGRWEGGGVQTSGRYNLIMHFTQFLLSVLYNLIYNPRL